MRAVASSVAILAYCLWAFEKSATVGEQAWFELSIIPFALGILRYAFLLSQGDGGAPEELVLSDRVLLGIGVVWVVCFADRGSCRLTIGLLPTRTARGAHRLRPHRADAGRRVGTAAHRTTSWRWSRPPRRRDAGRRAGSSHAGSAAATATPRRTRGGDVVRCTQLDRILELDVAKGTCTVEAGVSIEMLMRVFLPLGWFPMVVPGTRYVTVGGAIASDIHGKFRHGSFADSGRAA